MRAQNFQVTQTQGSYILVPRPIIIGEILEIMGHRIFMFM